MGAPNFPAGGGLRGQRWFRRAERVAAESTVALPVPWQAARIATFACEDKMGSVIDDYLVDPKVSLLDKTRMQAQVLLPVLRAFRAEFGKDKADAIVKQALRDWSKQLFAAIGDGIEGGPRRKWAAINSVFGEVSGKEVEIEILRHDEEALDIDRAAASPSSSARSASPSSVRC
jgi:hypothetical protein